MFASFNFNSRDIYSYIWLKCLHGILVDYMVKTNVGRSRSRARARAHSFTFLFVPFKQITRFQLISLIMKSNAQWYALQFSNRPTLMYVNLIIYTYIVCMRLQCSCHSVISFSFALLLFWFQIMMCSCKLSYAIQRDDDFSVAFFKSYRIKDKKKPLPVDCTRFWKDHIRQQLLALHHSRFFRIVRIVVVVAFQ